MISGSKNVWPFQWKHNFILLHLSFTFQFWTGHKVPQAFAIFCCYKDVLNSPLQQVKSNPSHTKWGVHITRKWHVALVAKRNTLKYSGQKDNNKKWKSFFDLLRISTDNFIWVPSFFKRKKYRTKDVSYLFSRKRSS